MFCEVIIRPCSNDKEVGGDVAASGGKGGKQEESRRVVDSHQVSEGARVSFLVRDGLHPLCRCPAVPDNDGDDS